MGDSLEITDNKYIVEACKRQNENIQVLYQVSDM